MKDIVTYINEEIIFNNQLITESISKIELKNLLAGKNLSKNEIKQEELFDLYKKLKTEFDEKSKNALLKKDYDLASKLVIKWNKKQQEINNEIKKLSDIIHNEKKDNLIKRSIFLDIVNIYSFVKESIKNINKDFVELIYKMSGENGINNFIFGPVRIFINDTIKCTNEKINEYIKEHNSIIEDIDAVLKYLKMNYLLVRDNNIKWNPKNIQNLIDNLSGKQLDIDLRDVQELLNEPNEIEFEKSNQSLG